MILSEIPRRLALVLALQIAVCVYVVVGVGVLVKVRLMGEQDLYYPVSAFALWIRSRGWMLMALPIAWYWFQVRRWMKAGADWGFLAGVVASGIGVLLLLVGIAVIASADLFRVKHFWFYGH